MNKVNFKRVFIAVFVVAWFYVMFLITPRECYTAPGNAVPKYCVD